MSEKRLKYLYIYCMFFAFTLNKQLKQLLSYSVCFLFCNISKVRYMVSFLFLLNLMISQYIISIIFCR